MKKNVLAIIFVFLASATVFSQKKENTVVVKQCLDSIVSTDGYKTVFSYDSNGRILQINIFEENNVRSEQRKQEVTYDKDGNVIQFIRYHWNKQTNKWVNLHKGEQTYDKNGNPTI